MDWVLGKNAVMQEEQIASEIESFACGLTARGSSAADSLSNQLRKLLGLDRPAFIRQ
jgi:hypothetical protein